jgi:hypothetical protein
MFIKEIAIGGTKVPGKGDGKTVHTQALSRLAERQAPGCVDFTGSRFRYGGTTNA